MNINIEQSQITLEELYKNYPEFKELDRRSEELKYIKINVKINSSLAEQEYLVYCNKYPNEFVEPYNYFIHDKECSALMYFKNGDLQLIPGYIKITWVMDNDAAFKKYGESKSKIKYTDWVESQINDAVQLYLDILNI